MNCPSCGHPDSCVASEIVDSETVIRQRQCICGFRWVTAETFITPSARSIQAFERNLPRVNAVEIEKNVVSTRVEGGFRGVSASGSDLVPVSSDPSQQSGSGARAIRRGRPDLTVYPTEFEVLWAAARKQGKCGNKLPAFKSWERLNTDDHLNALILTRFEEWAGTDRWKRGFNPHFVTWLNQCGWEESPTSKDISGPDASVAGSGANGSGSAASPRGSDYCMWHQRHQNDGTASRYPKAGCPGCQAVETAEAKRAHAASVAQIMAERARLAR